MTFRFLPLLRRLAALALLLGAVGIADLAVSPDQAFAQSARELKSTGLVGETLNGYLGMVTGGGGDLQQAVDEINAARRQAYREAAARSGRPVSEVEAVAGAQLRQKAEAGDWIQNAAGQWVQVR